MKNKLKILLNKCYKNQYLYRNAIPDDYIVFLQEHEKNNGKWIEAMKEEYKFMQDNKVWELVSLPEGVNPLVANGILRPDEILTEMWRCIGFIL